MSTFLFLELKLLFVMIFSINTSLQNILHRMLSWHGFYFCYFLILFNFLCMKTEIVYLSISLLYSKLKLFGSENLCVHVVYYVHLIFLSVVLDSTSDQCSTKEF